MPGFGRVAMIAAHPASIMRFLSIRVCFMLTIVALTACHDATGPEPVTSTGLRFSGAANLADTVGASFTQALLVEVHDSSGRVAPQGTVVRFTAVYAPPRGPEAFVAPLTSQSYVAFTTSTTDDQGHTGVLVQLGKTAGTARLAVSVPELGLEDTVRFTVNPGNAARALISPSDTLLYAGKSFTLRGQVVDRWGNPRTDPITWNSAGSELTVTSGGLVTAAAVGRQYVTATGAWGVDSSGVTIVPTGQLAAFSGGGYGAFTIFTLDMDGSKLQTIASGTDGGIGAHPAWIPGTTTVVYTTVEGAYQRLYAAGADGVVKPFFTTSPPNMSHEAEPTPSADGQWLYFVAYDSLCSAYAYCVSRSKTDGSAPELVIATPSRSPSPSPDGSKVAYRVGDGETVKVFDVTAGTASTWSVNGSWPAWSPDGTQIAYRSSIGTIAFVTPDGSPGTTLSPAVTTDAIRGWSPDGKWLLVSHNGMPTLVDAANGTMLPLPYAAGKETPTSMK